MYHYLYKISACVTPLKTDCGIMCDHICCRPDDKNSLGIYLFPGEEKMFSGKEDWLRWEEHDRDENLFPSSWPAAIYFVQCTKPCPRELRPLACRFFPLAPHMAGNGRLQLIYETIPLPYRCPLIENKIPLQKKFINMVALCWEILLTDHRIKDLVMEDSQQRITSDDIIEIVQ